MIQWHILDIKKGLQCADLVDNTAYQFVTVHFHLSSPEPL